MLPLLNFEMKHTLNILLATLLVCCNALYSPSDDVVELTPTNFNNKVIGSDEIWLIEFYAPWCGHCKSLAPEWKKAATALKGVVKIGAVDCDQHKALGGQYGVRGFPTIKVFGSNKNKAEDYNGGRTAQAIVDTALAKVKQAVNERMSGKSSGGKSGGGGGSGNKDDVVELTDSNFDKEVLQTDEMVLVEFFAPWCGHCKSLTPHWQKAATQLKGKVKIAALDATVHTVMAQKYGIQGFPTIKMFPSGKKDGEAVEYDGGRTASDIVAWALERVSENIAPPEIVELTAKDTLEKACANSQLCIISILPNILDCQSSCRNGYLKVLSTLGEKYKKRQWGYVWAEGGAQPEVEQAFEMGGFGYPAMAALNARKMKYAPLRGSFSEDGINEFLREVAVGRGSTISMRNSELPKVLEIEAWDGKDGQPPVEEEYDLSDVDLDDLEEDTKDEL